MTQVYNLPQSHSRGATRFSTVHRPISPGMLMMFLGHFLAASAAAYGTVILPGAVWAYAALIIFVSFCFGLLKNSPATFLFFGPLLALRITEFMSGAAIESGAYMTETAAHGQATGGFTRLLLIYLLFFAVAAVVTETIWPRLRPAFIAAPKVWARQASLLWKVLIATFVVGTIYLTYIAFNNGTPLFDRIDRFRYLSDVNSRVYTFVLRNRIILVPFIGALFCIRRYRDRAIFLLLWLLSASIIFGEKFTSLLLILSVFVIPVGLVRIANKRAIPMKFIATISAVVVIITVPAVLVAYGAIDDPAGAAKRYGERVALQGQLWYHTDQLYLKRPSVDPSAFQSDMATWLDPASQEASKADTHFGLYYVMAKFTPSLLLGWVMETGNGFVFSLYPYLLLSLGILGMLFVSSLIAAFHAWSMALLAECLARSSWLASVALGRVMSSFYACYTTGFLWHVFGIKNVLPLVAGILLLWWARRKGRSTSLVPRVSVGKRGDR